MSSTPQQPEHFDPQILKLLPAYCDQRLTREEMQALEQRLLDDPQLQVIAVTFMRLHAEMVWQYGGMVGLSSADSSNAIICSAIDDSWGDLGEGTEVVAKPAPRPTVPEPPTLLAALTSAVAQRLKYGWVHFRRRWLDRPRRGWSEGIIGLATLALIALLLTMPAPQSPPVLATYANGVNARWVDDDSSLVIGSEMTAGVFSLSTGVVELEFESGATAVLEGPCRFNLLAADTLELRRGKAFIHVGPEVETFVVETQNGRIVDLGTAFGVHALDDGSVETLVAEGRVTIAARGTPDAEPQLVMAGYRGSIDTDGRVSESMTPVAEYEYWNFRRQVAIEIDLAQLIVDATGGDPRGCGINPSTGEVLDWEAFNSGQGQVAFWDSDQDGFQPVSAIPFIDGVFVPHDGAGVQIASDGRVFRGFPTNNENRTWNYLWFGQKPSLPKRDEQGKQEYYDKLARLAGDRLVIFMPSPKGVTFDLQALNRLHPELEPVRFRAAVMNTAADFQNPSVRADFWALADGQVLAVHRDLTTRSGIVAVDVELPPGVQSLSLLSTVGSDQVSLHDRIVLQRAAIDFAPRVVIPTR